MAINRAVGIKERFAAILLEPTTWIIPNTAVSPEGELNPKTVFKEGWGKILAEESTFFGKLRVVWTAWISAFSLHRNHYLYGDFGGKCIYDRLSGMYKLIPFLPGKKAKKVWSGVRLR
jgi:hypothetical protein